jgi:hypothetical protein
VSRASAQHRKPSRSSSTRPSQTGPPSLAARPGTSARPGLAARHRKPSPVASVLHHTPARLAAAVAGSALIASATWQAAPSLLDKTHHPAATGQVDAAPALGADAHASQPAGAGPKTKRSTVGLSGLHVAHASSSPALSERQRRRPARAPQPASAPAPVYLNPLRAVSGLMPERIDMGVDFGGSGPVYALGDAVITNATGSSSGWPGGGWITYRLTDGPDSGLTVYVAEDVTPAVQAGEHVSSSTVIANMYAGGDGIETGWAMPDGASAESQLPAAGGISGGGPFPTMIGLSFEELLQSLGVPAANNRSQPASGILPANYPAN